MTTIRKRRWILSTVALGLAAAVGFVVVRENPDGDLPRLVVLKKRHLGTEQYVYFRLDAPKHKRASFLAMSTLNPATGVQRKPTLQGVGATFNEIVLMGQAPDSSVHYVLPMEAGQSKEFRVTPPIDNVWRLRCHVGLEKTGIRVMLTRLRLCWRQKSLAPLRWRQAFGPPMIIESEPITNAPSRRLGNPQP